MSHLVVVDDPMGEYWEGSLIEEKRAEMLKARGLIALPVDPELIRISGVGGFYKRSYGSGWPLSNAAPTGNCPVTLYTTRNHHRLGWAARLVLDPSAPQKNHVGLLRLTSDTAQATAMQGGFVGNDPRDKNLIDVSKLGSADAEGGWTVTGTGTIRSTGEGYLALTLYGTAPGLAVEWLAVAVAL